MSAHEKEIRYREAIRYMQNAVDILKTKARKKDRYYEDQKYVRMACATAYNAVLLALDSYLEIKGKETLELGKEIIRIATEKGGVPFWFYNDESLLRQWVRKADEAQYKKQAELHLELMKKAAKKR